MRKIIKYIKYPPNVFLYLDSRGLIRLNEKLFLKIKYKSVFNKKLDLENPQTFNEKLQWLKLYDRKDIYTTMVDKYEAKKYVANIIGEEYIIPTIGIYDKFEDIDFENLPNQFVLKCTHDSGGVVICKNKETFDIKKAKKKINEHLKINYYYIGREWPYKNIKPRIIVEKYMGQANSEDLIDYKLMTFNGKVECSFVCLNRNSENGMKIDFYDTNWRKMPFERHYKNSDIILEKPKNYNLMVSFAEKLAKDIPFLRVDFYEIEGKVYFGELTFYPGSGLEEFNPPEWDRKLGEKIKLE